jgi:hypothetical protein
MRARMSLYFVVACAVCLAVTAGACVDNNAFQPITTGAKPWTGPAGFGSTAQFTCAPGYYVAIDSCPGCTGISYALCTGQTFDQCVCGGPPWPGGYCPNQLPCAPDNFPPIGWLEYTDYIGPGWAGLDLIPKPDAGMGGGG